MKILAVVHCYLPLNRGGAELMMHQVLSSLVSKGHEVTVAVTEGGPRGAEVDVDGVRVRYVNPRDEFDKKPDRVITHLKETARVLSWAKPNKVHSTVLVHSDHKWILLDLVQRPDLIVFNTQWVRDSVSKRIDILSNSCVLHPPVDAARFVTTPGDHVTLVNPIPEKGSEVFYTLARRLPDRKFLVVEGGYERNRQVFQPLPNVTVQPHTSNMRDDVYSRTKVLVVPSHFESFGMVAVEAAISGIPVVASPTPGLLESLGGFASYIDVNDTESWVRRVDELTSDETRWSEASCEISRVRGIMESPAKLARVLDSMLKGEVR